MKKLIISVIKVLADILVILVFSWDGLQVLFSDIDTGVKISVAIMTAYFIVGVFGWLVKEICVFKYEWKAENKETTV